MHNCGPAIDLKKVTISRGTGEKTGICLGYWLLRNVEETDLGLFLAPPVSFNSSPQGQAGLGHEEWAGLLTRN